MTPFEKLEAILACVQTDPGNRGLARDPVDNLFTATAGDYQVSCQRLAETGQAVGIVTGFFIPSATRFETDGPLGAFFLERTLLSLGYTCSAVGEDPIESAFSAVRGRQNYHHVFPNSTTFNIAIERTGQALDRNYYTMSGVAVGPHIDSLFDELPYSIGIGDGGNEIGMGKIPHETIVKNIPNGDLIHCRVPTDHLIVAGVSNWGAYALAAGVYVLRNEKPPANLFDPDYERKILQLMVDAGPLVDGVTGKQEATVDGLSWDEYVKPLIRMREILEC